MNIRVRYRRVRVKVPSEARPDRCECCGRKGRTELHHWRYSYKTSEVIEHPILALHNTSCLCFTCHRVANAMTNYNKARPSVKWFMHQEYMKKGRL